MLQRDRWIDVAHMRANTIMGRKGGPCIRSSDVRTHQTRITQPLLEEGSVSVLSMALRDGEVCGRTL